jgi:hypothetical protein
MKLKRHFLISDDLDDLELLEEQLEAEGILQPQIHILSLDDTSVESRGRLHDVTSLMKKDLISSGVRGAVIGVSAAALALLIPYAMGWTDTAAGWIPFIFLAIILLGFCTWEGGFVGIQTSNRNFRRFEADLNAGRHVFFVDLEPGQEPILRRILQSHPKAQDAGDGPATPHWVVFSQYRLKRLFAETLP